MTDPGLKAWAHYDILRARLAEADAQANVADWPKEVGEPDKLAYLLAWSAMARHMAVTAGSATAEKEVRAWDKEALRPFGLAGVALADVPE